MNLDQLPEWQKRHIQIRREKEKVRIKREEKSKYILNREPES